MSYDIHVFVPEDKELSIEQWQKEYELFGFRCEIRPDFSNKTWTGSDFITKVSVIPNMFAGYKVYGDKPIALGCGLELWQADEAETKEKIKDYTETIKDPAIKRLSSGNWHNYMLQIAYSAPKANWRFLIATSLTLTRVTNGILIDPQTNEVASGDEDKKEYLKGINLINQGDMGESKEKWKPIKFTSWERILIDAIPSFNEL